MIKISFIIPAYNRERLIEKTINTIKGSSDLKNFEIVVVDDNSSDNTVNMLGKRYPSVRVVQNVANKGPAVCRNQGIQASKGDYLFFIDSDVFLTRNCFKKLLKSLRGYDIVFPTINFEDESRMYPSNENEKKFLKASTVFMVKKKSLEKLDEFFDADYYMVEEDTDLFIRCKIFGLKCEYVKNAKAYHVLESNLSLNLEKKYYLTVKNQIYSLLKLSNISSEAVSLFDFPRFKPVVKDFVMALFNINLLSVTSVTGRTKVHRDFLSKAKLLLGEHSRITPKNRLVLLFLFFKAIGWNMMHLRKTFDKKKELKKKLAHYL